MQCGVTIRKRVLAPATPVTHPGGVGARRLHLQSAKCNLLNTINQTTHLLVYAVSVPLTVTSVKLPPAGSRYASKAAACRDTGGDIAPWFARVFSVAVLLQSCCKKKTTHFEVLHHPATARRHRHSKAQRLHICCTYAGRTPPGQCTRPKTPRTAIATARPRSKPSGSCCV